MDSNLYFQSHYTVNIYRHKAIGANAFPGIQNYTGCCISPYSFVPINIYSVSYSFVCILLDYLAHETCFCMFLCSRYHSVGPNLDTILITLSWEVSDCLKSGVVVHIYSENRQEVIQRKKGQRERRKGVVCVHTVLPTLDVAQWKILL